MVEQKVRQEGSSKNPEEHKKIIIDKAAQELSGEGREKQVRA
jgi:hypothetical protein